MNKRDKITKVVAKKCEEYNSQKISEILSYSFKSLDIEQRLKKIKTALLKPNLIMAKKPCSAVTTHPIIVDAVCRTLKKINKNLKIFIGEASGSVLFGGTKSAFEISGIEDIAKKWNAKIICFETSKRRRINIKRGKISKSFYLPEEVLDCDYMINLPKLKTHNLTKYSGAVKNLYGLLNTSQKMGCHKKFYKPYKFAENLLDLYAAKKPDLNIMDAVICMEGNGPTAGSPKKLGAIFVSQDAIALDKIASNIIGFEEGQNPLMDYANKNHLLNKIELIGDEIPKTKFKKPYDLRNILPDLISINLQLLFVPNVRFDASKCKKCSICVKACPNSALTLNSKFDSKPKINYKKCIRCYCCHELCPNKAVMIKCSPFINIINFLLGREK